MFRNFLASTVQKKFFLMFFTCLIYIVGLFAFFNECAVLTSFILFILGICAIVKNYLSPKLVLFWYLVFFFAFFNANLRLKDADSLYQIAPQDGIIYGRIVSIPNQTSKDKIKFFFDVSKIEYNGISKKVNAKTLVTVYTKGKTSFNMGNTYKLKGKLRAPFEASNPSQFDYGKYLKNYNTFTLFYANNNDCKIQNTNLSFKWRFFQSLDNIRNDIILTHSKYLKSPNLELLGGIIFGDDAIAPPDDIKNSFKHSGLLHLLAASGMNVALIYGIWFFILSKLRAQFNLTVSSGIFVVIFYSFMTGLGPSVIRAAFMLIFVLLGKLIDRDAHSISLLSFVALLMLIYNPAYINDVGFQLSFLVTFGLLVMAPAIFEKTKAIPGWLSGAVFVPVIAQIWVAPIQMYYFNSFSLYSIFANILTLPFVTIVSFGGFISAVLALIKPIASQVCFVFDLILNPMISIIVWISNYFANLPHSLLSTPQPTLFQIFIYYMFILLMTLLLKIGINKKVFISTIIFACLLITSFIKTPNQDFETIAFDVKNADAFLIKTPKNKYFLIDSGKMSYKGGKTQAEVIILQYLKDKGIKNIEGFIITHFDSDHAGGALDLINNLNIKNIYVNSLNDKSNIAKKIYEAKKNKVIPTNNNQIIYKEGSFKIKTFIANLKEQKYENENSVITLVSDGNFDELFMGDAGIIAFEKIKKYLPSNIEILKIGHHGAKNVINKSFITRLHPQVALISTGQNNYGHPNGVTLDILKSQKVKIFRTDRKNAIKINYNNKFKLYTYDAHKGFIENYF